MLVVYNLDDFPTPYAKRIGSSDLTLGTFKDKVFARKGEYRSVQFVVAWLCVWL